MNEKIKIEALVEKSERVSNANDADRVFDVSANVRTSNGGVGNIDSGMVVKNGVQLASFNSYGGNSLNINYAGGTEEVDRAAVLAAIEGFIADVKAEGGEA